MGVYINIIVVLLLIGSSRYNAHRLPDRIPGASGTLDMFNFDALTWNLHEHCLIRGNIDSHESALTARNVYDTYFSQVLYTALDKMDPDVKAKMWCNKNIIENFVGYLQAVEPCVDEISQANNKLLTNVQLGLYAYSCGLDERMKQFYANDGVECLLENLDELDTCYKISQIHTAFENVKDYLDDKQCRALLVFETCAVKTLKTCDSLAAATRVGDTYNIMRNALNCETY